jgi:hypothetical protein
MYSTKGKLLSSWDTPNDVQYRGNSEWAINDALAQQGNNDWAENRSGAGWDSALNRGKLAYSRGPQATESQWQSANEQQARDYDQAGAMQLARDAAMGNAPSEAAYQLQAGLDAASASQASMAGGARGSAALALGQGNAAYNTANLQQQAFTQAGQLRAQEMANARGLYGSLSGQQREQDQNRLSLGNQMSQYNASLNDQQAYNQGMLGVQYGNLANNQSQVDQAYYNTGANIGSQQFQTDWQREQARLNQSNWGREMGMARLAEINDNNADTWRAVGGAAGATLGAVGGFFAGGPAGAAAGGSLGYGVGSSVGNAAAGGGDDD